MVIAGFTTAAMTVAIYRQLPVKRPGNQRRTVERHCGDPRTQPSVATWILMECRRARRRN